jgi:DNA-binding response OmpR family regulator
VRILVAEDEAGVLAFISRALRAEGFVADCAADGADTLSRLDRERYDLLLLDLRLPQVSGLDVLRRLADEHAEVPVVVVSARSDLQTKLRAFELGACDYVAKPFALDELLARVRAQLRRKVQPRDDDLLLEVGRLTLDLARHEARLDDRTVSLTDREFRLLHHLAERPGEVVSRERLLAEVWGYHFDPRSNVVEVCVRRLRRKFGEVTVIETVRNAGYRLAS